MAKLRYPGAFMNYGVVPAFITPLPTSLIQADLNDMWSDGYRRIRLWIPNPQTSPAAAKSNILYIGDMAKAMGFYVMYGCTTLGTTLSDANWTAISAAVVAQAAIAQSHGFDEFIIDNEARGRISGLTNFFTKYDALATACKTAGFTGIVSYNESENQIADWVGQTIGTSGTVHIDMFGMNTYGGSNNDSGNRFSLLNLNQCWTIFGSKSYISETNIYSSNPYTGLDNRQIYQGSKDKMDMATRIGFVYVGWFSWTSPSDQFSVKNADRSYRRNRYVFTNVRRLASEVVN